MQIETNLLSYSVLDIRAQEFSNFDSEKPQKGIQTRKSRKYDGMFSWAGLFKARLS